MSEEKEEKLEFKVIAKVPDEPIGWIEATLPKTVMMRLQSYIETAKINPVNHNSQLAGNITKSLIIEDKDNWFFKTVLIPLIDKYQENYPKYADQISVLTENAPYCLERFWVNFQKENEFNPLHNHAGVWAFVIWVNIPTDWREQHALPISANSNSPKASDFEFQYTSIFGAISYYSYLLNKKSEGGILLFPAKLNHTVHPFYNCEEERISISGNIRLDISENSMKQYRTEMKGKNGEKSS